MFEISSDKKGFVSRKIYFIKRKVCWIGKSFVRGNRSDLDHVFWKREFGALQNGEIFIQDFFTQKRNEFFVQQRFQNLDSSSVWFAGEQCGNKDICV